MVKNVTKIYNLEFLMNKEQIYSNEQKTNLQ